ncbi:hypothetical protein [Roseateles sp.]|uniref:hypothetical protein n=1 Tax=Roseateles sp. TaxID=1971397 RepID=UPI0031E16A6B
MDFPLNFPPSSSFEADAAASQTSANSRHASALLEAKLIEQQKKEVTNFTLETVQAKYNSLQNIKL